MKTTTHRFTVAVLLLVMSPWSPWLPSHAENIDPGSADSQYAYGENVGWVNAEPQGDGGPGVHVTDFALTGWMWAENAGWISLSCENTASCDATEYGVVNDGLGVLSGLAWSENAGWINFAPATGGVTIDPVTGRFDGNAWAENAGWISFASVPLPFRAQANWSCSPLPPAPGGSPVLAVEPASVSWTSLPGATGYDVVSGDLSTLIATGGDFTAASNGCVAENETSTDHALPDTPAPGEGVWYVVRGVNCGASGTYDSGGAAQSGSRDAELDAAPDGCF